MGSQRVKHNRATSLSFSFSFICNVMTLSNSFKKSNLLLISQQIELSGGKKIQVSFSQFMEKKLL